MEGHEAKLWIRDKAHKKIADGFVQKCDPPTKHF